jgi:hypothetical protein
MNLAMDFSRGRSCRQPTALVSGFGSAESSFGTMLLGKTRATRDKMTATPIPATIAGVELLGDNAAPEAGAVYGALGIPFVSLVNGLNQYFSRQH